MGLTVKKTAGLIALLTVPLGAVLLLSNQGPHSKPLTAASMTSMASPSQGDDSSSLPTPPPSEEAGRAKLAETTPRSDDEGPNKTQMESQHTELGTKGRISDDEQLAIKGLKLADIDQAISKIEHFSMFEYKPIIDQLNNNALVRRQWIDRLKSDKDQANQPTTARILSKLDKTEVIPFLQEAVRTGDSDLLSLSVDTLVYMYNVNPVDVGIVDEPLDLLPDSEDTYTYANAIKLLTNRGIDYSPENAQRLSSSLSEGLYDESPVVRFAALEAQFKLGTMSASDTKDAVLNELTHNDRRVRSRALAHLEYWMEAGYQPSDYTKNRLLDQILEDYSTMDDGDKGDVAYLLSTELELTKEQVAKARSAGVNLTPPNE